ncbi:MAG: hypothetical protein M1429_00875 [Patescibacteria group bacterium]|nr:hypothetical protein [Patescibacteria group bacterium]
MKKIYLILKEIIRDFIFNSFWKSWPALLIIASSLILNGILWYIFLSKIKVNFIPFIFASGLIFLNLILGNYLWEKEKIASFFLISVGLFVQVLMLVFIRFLMLVF